MIIKNYNSVPMNDLAEADYETLLVHLTEQVAHCIRYTPEEEAAKAASFALTRTWSPTLTAREWLAAAGFRLSADTSGCIGV